MMNRKPSKPPNQSLYTSMLFTMKKNEMGYEVEAEQ